MGIVNFEIVELIAKIGEAGKWNLELNRVSWNGKAPKYDLRAWSEDHDKCGKGVTMTEKEARALKYVLEDFV